MKKSELKKARRRIGRFRVTSGKKFRLKDYDPADTGGLSLDGDDSRMLLQQGVEDLEDLQDKLYAQDRWGVLLIFQGMDAAGKDSTIKHVMSGVNPEGVEVSSFKEPSQEEIDHDFLWRTTRRMPERGRIGIFNRSYYEEVLVVRVHPAILDAQKIPAELVTPGIWAERYEDINAFERYVSRNGYLVLKFFLHVSKREQKRRFLERLDQPEKNWKFSSGDVKERALWNDYQKAYESMIAATSTSWAPWHVIPADDKSLMRIAVAATIVEALHGLGLRYPKIGKARRKELEEAREALV